MAPKQFWIFHVVFFVCLFSYVHSRSFPEVINVSNNQVSGTVNVRNESPISPSPDPQPQNGFNVDVADEWNTRLMMVVGISVGGICAMLLIFIAIVCICYKRKLKNKSRIDSTASDTDHVKITIDGYGGLNETVNQTHGSNNMVIPFKVLKKLTNDFNPDNILGKGSSATVYKAELHDGTKLAVKRLQRVASDDEFKYEIAVLTNLKHRHLLALPGYCLDGNERLLVYEYMPQGTLGRFLFHWKDQSLKPLEWTQRLIIALDVARGVEYLHCLAQQSFIHRDLKSSNILLDDDMRAKVADFGLIRSAPKAEYSLYTGCAGSFGYIAPEYAELGKLTTKVDIYSFGVILMELITGQKAVKDGRRPMVQWFKRMQLKSTMQKAIDPILKLDEEALASVSKVAELAGHCCAYEQDQRPDMSHVVSALSSLADPWKPTQPDSHQTLPQLAIAEDGYFSGLSNSFTSLDGR